ncbi:MAG: ROK family protein [Xanthobacteraceae bacterium]|nr:MAG: ROK family protein [Xanthobacteraceae bacterium]
MNQDLSSLIAHGATTLPLVEVRSYNVEIEDEDGFVGDRASKSAFRNLIDDWRKVVRKAGEDPLGDKDIDEISNKKLDLLLSEGDPEAAGIIHGAIEDFAQQFAAVIRRFLKLKYWRETQRIVVGGGLRASRVGELIIGRATVLLKAEQATVDLVPIHNHPDDAALIGAVHLMPRWMFKGHDAILAVDIGGSKIRAGVVMLNLKKNVEVPAPSVWRADFWKYSEEKKISRDDAVQGLVDMVKALIDQAEKEKLMLAPFIGIGCPGRIAADGTIESGAQNLPGNWESQKFNLARSIRDLIPAIGEHETAVVMHNDAVIQGLSEVSFMSDVEYWSILTIGTGLGNAQFVNRQEKPA